MNKFYDWLQMAIIALYAVVAVGIVLAFMMTDAKADTPPAGVCYDADHFVADTFSTNAAKGVEVLIVEDLIGDAATAFAEATGWVSSDGHVTRAILFGGIQEGELNPVGVIVLFIDFQSMQCARGTRQFLIENAGPLMKQLREKYSG